MRRKYQQILNGMHHYTPIKNKCIKTLWSQITPIVGAGSGIGKAVCQAFAKQGALVAAVDINEKAVEETLVTLASK